MPMRILLVGAVVFLAAWFTILKPKPEEVPPITTSTTPAGHRLPARPSTRPRPPPVRRPRRRRPTPTPLPRRRPRPRPRLRPPRPSAIPAEALAKLPKDVAAALEARKVLVLGVFADEAKPWRPMSDDDRYMRNALRDDQPLRRRRLRQERQHRRTFRPTARWSTTCTSTSPRPIVVIDANLKGRVLTGYADRISINQVIADAHDASVEPDIKDAYLRRFNDTCGRFKLRAKRWSCPTVRGKQGDGRLARPRAGHRRAATAT